MKSNEAIMKYLVQWKGLAYEDATWVEAQEFENQFPDFEA